MRTGEGGSEKGGDRFQRGSQEPRGSPFASRLSVMRVIELVRVDDAMQCECCCGERSDDVMSSCVVLLNAVNGTLF